MVKKLDGAKALDRFGAFFDLTEVQQARLRPAVAALPGSQLPAQVTSGGAIDLMAQARAILDEQGEALTDDAPSMVVHDLAGQRMYYVLHGLLLSENLTQYVVAASLEHDLDTPLGDPEDAVFGMTHGENLDFWLSSIFGRAPSARILVVCTKLDLVDEATRERRLAAVWASFESKAYENAISAVLCVSSKTGEGVEGVRRLLQDEAKPFDPADGTGLKRYGDEVPLGWFKFQALVKELAKQGTWQITLADARELAEAECGVDSDEEMARMLREFNDIGNLVWQNEPDTRDMIVLDVQWCCDHMTTMLCQRSLTEKHHTGGSSPRWLWTDALRGRLSPRLLPELWPDLEQPERERLLAYMVRFGLCTRLVEQACAEEDWPHIVPSLLPKVASDREVWASDAEHDRQLRVSFIHAEAQQEWSGQHGFLPDTLFFKVVSVLLSDATGQSLCDNAFRDLYLDRVVIQGDQRFMLRHYRQQQCLELTVYGSTQQEYHAVATQLRLCLEQLQGDFGVRFRFEVRCSINGKAGYYALDHLPASHEAARTWGARLHPPAPEPESDSVMAPEPEPPEPASSAVVRVAVASPASVSYQSCLDRYFVQLEVKKAKQERKNVISVFEQEERRHSYFDYTKAWAKYGTGAGQAAAHGGEFEFVLNVDSIRYLRNHYEADAMVHRIIHKATSALPAPSASPINAPGQWDFFLSHGQALAGDQTKMLCFLLRQRTKPNGEPYTVWYRPPK
jgi:hypothetical protein